MANNYRTQNYSNQNIQSTQRDFQKEFKDDWVLNDIDSDFIKYAEVFAEEIANNNLTTSQIRNVFSELKRIEMNKNFKDNKTDFLLLLPKLAYAKKRNRSIGFDRFYDVFKKAHSLVFKNEEKINNSFNNFCRIMEAIIAYHKYYSK